MKKICARGILALVFLYSVQLSASEVLRKVQENRLTKNMLSEPVVLSATLFAALMGAVVTKKAIDIVVKASETHPVQVAGKVGKIAYRVPKLLFGWKGNEHSLLQNHWLTKENTWLVAGAAGVAIPVFVMLAKQTVLVGYIQARGCLSRIGKFCFVKESFSNLHSLKKAVAECEEMNKWGLDDLIAGDNQEAKIGGIIESVEKDLNKAQRLLLGKKSTWLPNPLFGIITNICKHPEALFDEIGTYRSNLQAAKDIIEAVPGYKKQKKDYRGDRRMNAEEQKASALHRQANSHASLVRLGWVEAGAKLIYVVCIKAPKKIFVTIKDILI